MPGDQILDGVRNPNAQSPKGMRFQEYRSVNYTDPKTWNALVAHTANWTHDADGKPIAPGDQVALPATEGAATKGFQFKVLGYERLTLLMDWIQGAMTNLNVLVQTSSLGGTDDSNWYDVYEGTFASLTRGMVTFGVSADGRQAVQIPTCGRYMRLIVWGTAADAATRARVLVVRHMDSV